jgi:predicted  nucleic acid-binding Zn-ribbon protein
MAEECRAADQAAESEPEPNVMSKLVAENAALQRQLDSAEFRIREVEIQKQGLQKALDQVSHRQRDAQIKLGIYTDLVDLLVDKLKG